MKQLSRKEILIAIAKNNYKNELLEIELEHCNNIENKKIGFETK